MPEYTEDEFVAIGRKILPPELNDELAESISRQVYQHKGDPRKILQVGKLVRIEDTPETISQLIETMSEAVQV